jgi:hypothetical protein
VTEHPEQPEPEKPEPGPSDVDATGPQATEPTPTGVEPAAAPEPGAVHRHGSGSMYGWLWRHLPGSRAAKVTILVVAAAVVVVLLFGVVFPWVEPRLPFNQVTVGGG